MDTVGTFEMAKALAEHKCYTCVHKYYSVEDWKEFAASNKAVLPFVAASSGTAEGDFERLCDILESIPEVSGGGLTSKSKGYLFSFEVRISKSFDFFSFHRLNSFAWMLPMATHSFLWSTSRKSVKLFQLIPFWLETW